MTVPQQPRFDDWAFELCNSSGAPICPLNTSIIDIEGWAIPGATAHRLESLAFAILDTSLAASYLDWTAIQFVRITPYADPTHSLWGIVGKPKQGYSARGLRDAIVVTCVGTEYLLKSRHVYHRNGTTIEPISITNGKADDFAKKLVRYCALSGTCATDIDGNSRNWNWGTLAVEADTSECTDSITQSILGCSLYDAIEKLGYTYGFDWELRPTIASGVVTFTFATKSPRGGKDRTKDNTDGNDPILINDFAGMVPAGSRYRDWFDMVNAQHGRGYRTVEINSPSISSWGRWEGLSNLWTDAELQQELVDLDIKEGAEYTYDATTTAGECRWMAEYEVGDLVTRNNIRLGIDAEDDTIRAIKFTFPNKLLKLEIRWGDKEPTFTDKSGGGTTTSGGDTPLPPVADAAEIKPIAATNIVGTSDAYPPADHQHRGVILDDNDDIIEPTVDGEFKIHGLDGIIVEKDAVDDSLLTISGAGVGANVSFYGDDDPVVAGYFDPDASYKFGIKGGTGITTTVAADPNNHYITINSAWQRTAGTPNWIGPATSTDKVVLNAAGAPAGANTWLYVNGDIEVESTVKAYTGRLYLSGQDGTIDCYTSGTATTFNVDDGAGVAQIGLLATGTSYFSGGNLIVQNSKNFETYADTGGESMTAQLAGASGNLWLITTATTHFGGYTYTWPTDGAATGEALIATVSGANITLSWEAPSAAAHNLLSATHGDTTAAAAVAGDIIIADATPKWTRLAKGAQYDMLVMGATLPAWTPTSNLAGAGLTYSAGALSVGAGNGISVTADAVALGALSSAWDAGAYTIQSDYFQADVRADVYALRFTHGTAAALSSDVEFRFYTTTAAAQVARTGGLQVSSSYGGPIPTNGILFGSDTNLYRSAADTLKTDDALYVTGTITAAAPGTSVACSGDITMIAGKTVDGVDISAHYHRYYRCAGGSGPLSATGGDWDYIYAAADASGTKAAWKSVSNFLVTLTSVAESLQNTTAPV